jgi:hypothetical protein
MELKFRILKSHIPLLAKLPVEENPIRSDVIMCKFAHFMFTWMLALKLIRFLIFVRVCLDNN